MSAIPDIRTLMEQGTCLADPLPGHLRFSNLPRMAIISIRAGLRAYFSTYRIAGVSQVLSQGPSQPLKHDEIIRQESSPDYLEVYTETVLHLHYAIELALKELLRQKHTLLASSNLPHSAILLCRLLHKESISFKDEETLKSAEFAEALKRVITLANAKLLDGDLSIVINHKTLLEVLNTLRNKIIHRGLFVMDYSAFDLVISAHIIPFLAEFLYLPQFEIQANLAVSSETTPLWKYKKLACGIDPLKEIANIGKNTEHAWEKLALLKELGRAAYQNPLDAPESSLAPFGVGDSNARCRAEQLAKHELSNLNPYAYHGANEILKCPVCGLHSLVRYNDGDGNDTEVICTCCTFNVNRALGNAGNYGLPIDGFWSP